MTRLAKNEEIKERIHWKRDLKGKPIHHGTPLCSCIICNTLLYDNVDARRLVTCADCVQALISMDSVKREVLKDKVHKKFEKNG
jgi:hypothetical protein